jgi:hypothetical protein
LALSRAGEGIDEDDMGDGEDPVIRNYLEWSDEGRPAIWRYLAAIVLGFVF